MTVPPPHAGHADFVTLRSRFDAALARTWAPGEPCKVRSTALEAAAAFVDQLRCTVWPVQHIEGLQNSLLIPICAASCTAWKFCVWWVCKGSAVRVSAPALRVTEHIVYCALQVWYVEGRARKGSWYQAQVVWHQVPPPSPAACWEWAGLWQSLSVLWDGDDSVEVRCTSLASVSTCSHAQTRCLCPAQAPAGSDMASGSPSAIFETGASLATKEAAPALTLSGIVHGRQ